MSKSKGFHKKPSKRTPLRRKYKIEKKVREHNRKMKRLAKKDPNKKSGKRKDVTMPRNAPFSRDWDGLTYSGPLDRKKSKGAQDVETAAIVPNLAPVMVLEDVPQVSERASKVSTDVRMDDDNRSGASIIMDKLNSHVKQMRESKTEDLLKGMQVNKERRNQQKRLRQKQKKLEKISGKLADSLDLNVTMDDGDADDNYDFETDFK